MQIIFSLPHVFYPGSPRDVNTSARVILAKTLAQLNAPYRNSRSGPALYQARTASVVWNLPHVFEPGISIEENTYALRCLLDCLVEFNCLFLERNRCKDLYLSDVFYHRTEVWDSIPALYRRGYGDCKSLTAAYVAQHQMRGDDCTPVFRGNPRSDKSGARDYHILVMNSDGTFEDPSKTLGMGDNEVQLLR